MIRIFRLGTLTKSQEVYIRRLGNQQPPVCYIFNRYEADGIPTEGIAGRFIYASEPGSNYVSQFNALEVEVYIDASA